MRDRAAVDAELARIAERVHADRADGDRELRLARRSLLRMENAQRDAPAAPPTTEVPGDAIEPADFFDVDPELIEAMPLLDEDAR
ncbi:MAG: hypothetical protein ACLGI2_06635 [Acidimicrobiia bacterium]